MALKIYTVRNAAGQFLSEFYAKDAKHAIQKLVESDAAMNTTFRKSHRQQIDPATLTASVEARSPYTLDRGPLT